MSDERLETRAHRAARSRARSVPPSRRSSPSVPTPSRPPAAAVPRSPASSPAARGTSTEILADSDLIVELIGGTEPAREYVLAALRAGLPVVTANKQLLARHGDELFGAAREAGIQIRFEAAVAGVIPIVRAIQESFGAIEISKVFGIVNGTTNFILSEMAATGADYEEVLARAQELGYAEADPSEDVNGADAAAKMAILARLAFHTPVTIADVAYEGIETIQPDDLAYAKELGLSLKLLGVAERRDGAGSACGCSPASSTGAPALAGRRALQRGDGRGTGDNRGDDVRARSRRHPDGLRGARRPGLDPCRGGPGRGPAGRPRHRHRRQLLLLPPSRGGGQARGAGQRSPGCSATTRSR